MNYFLCSSHPSPGAYHLSTNQDLGVSGKETRLTLQSNDKFIRDIRKRLDENAVAREQREKRLQRFMIEQMKAREAQEVKNPYYHLTHISFTNRELNEITTCGPFSHDRRHGEMSSWCGV